MNALSVHFGDSLATINSITDTSIITTVPLGAITSQIKITKGKEQKTFLNLFKIISATSLDSFAITGFSPDSGSIGTLITIKGRGFSKYGGLSSVSFGSIPAKFDIPIRVNGSIYSTFSDSSFTAYVPSGAITSTITTRKDNHVAVSKLFFRVTAPNYLQDSTGLASFKRMSVSFNNVILLETYYQKETYPGPDTGTINKIDTNIFSSPVYKFQGDIWTGGLNYLKPTGTFSNGLFSNLSGTLIAGDQSDGYGNFRYYDSFTNLRFSKLPDGSLYTELSGFDAANHITQMTDTLYNWDLIWRGNNGTYTFTSTQTHNFFQCTDSTLVEIWLYKN